MRVTWLFPLTNLAVFSCALPPFHHRDVAADQSVPEATPDTAPVDTIADAPSAPDAERFDAVDTLLLNDVSPAEHSATDAATEGPRLLRPLSGAVYFSARPELRWEIAPETTRTRIELCAQRTCDTVAQQFESTSNTAQPPMPLARGTWFWRARGLRSDGSTTNTSATWEFFVRGTDGSPRIATNYYYDANGDGYTDIAIGSAAHPDYTGAREVYLYAGSRTPDVSPREPLRAVGTSRSFGRIVTRISDVNGDGFGDLLVSDSYTTPGTAYVFLGRPGALPDRAALRFVRNAPDIPNNFTLYAQGIGDINGDGYADVATMARTESGVPDGVFYLYLGASDGLRAAPDYLLPAPNGLRVYFGVVERFVGDFNGDGLGDVLGIGREIEAGRERFSIAPLTGTPTLQRSPFGTTNTLPTPFAPIADPSPSSRVEFGTSFDGIGDLDNDGFGDVVVGARGAGSVPGMVYLFHGSASGLSTAPWFRWDSPVAMGGRYGIRVNFAGDLNGDGRPDLAISADQALSNGRVYIYLGQAPSAPGMPPFPMVPSLSLEPPAPYVGIGGSGLNCIGDFDGDGFDDLAIGAHEEAPSGNDPGIVFIYRGGNTISTTPAYRIQSSGQHRFGFTIASRSELRVFSRESTEQTTLSTYAQSVGCPGS